MLSTNFLLMLVHHSPRMVMCRGRFFRRRQQPPVDWSQYNYCRNIENDQCDEFAFAANLEFGGGRPLRCYLHVVVVCIVCFCLLLCLRFEMDRDSRRSSWQASYQAPYLSCYLSLARCQDPKSYNRRVQKKCVDVYSRYDVKWNICTQSKTNFKISLSREQEWIADGLNYLWSFSDLFSRVETSSKEITIAIEVRSPFISP